MLPLLIVLVDDIGDNSEVFNAGFAVLINETEWDRMGANET